MTSDIQLSKNFKLSEFLHADDKYPPQWVITNLTRLAGKLQAVRDTLGKPILINSGYRTLEHNRAVGGAKKSFHTKGMAADIAVPGVPASEVQRILSGWPGGLGSYAHFTHLDIRPYRARWRQVDAAE